MIEFVFAKQNLPFTVSLTLMLFIALLEGVGSLMGLGMSQLLDTIAPDIDIDIDSPEIESPSGLTKFLGWLRIGQVPALVLLIVFLTSFGLVGLGIQTIAKNIFGTLAPASLACLPTLMISIPILRTFGGILAKILPKDETDAVSEESYIGRTASIVLGTASHGNPAQAKLKDNFGTTHYIMVEPHINGDVFEAETSVLIVSRNGSVFKAILNTNPALKD